MPQVVFVSTYPPRHCGLATFTHDLRRAVMAADPGLQAQVLAMTGPEECSYPPEVVREIPAEDPEEYGRAARFVNGLRPLAVSLQHEYGIFGGDCGEHVLAFARGLRCPLVVTLHTVLARPTRRQLRILQELGSLADAVVVMTPVARPILERIYGLDPARIHVIRHGAPPFPPSRQAKARLGLEGRTILSTFGLIGPGKGLEYALAALPEVVKAHPKVLYLILGRTHPNGLRGGLDEYRERLYALVDELGLGNHVRFENRYLSLDELGTYLAATDVYLTPYTDGEQISSGALTYAAAAGKAIVSTPYLYAKDLLGEGRGLFADFADPASLARCLRRLLQEEGLREALEERIRGVAQELRWDRVGARYARLFTAQGRLAGGQGRPALTVADNPRPLHPPVLTLAHLERLTDSVGVLEHGLGPVPNPREGYCTDDNARALAIALRHHRLTGDARSRELALRYLSFLLYAQRPDGAFHNDVAYDRTFLDPIGSEDCQGRALWGLGYALAVPTLPGVTTAAARLVRGCLPHVRRLQFPRAQAYALLGCVPVLDAWRRVASASAAPRTGEEPAALGEALAETAAELGEDLRRRLEEGRRPGWTWVEPVLTYDNPRVAEGLIRAGRALGRSAWVEAGLATLSFLWDYLYRNGCLQLVGNRGWARAGGPRALFDQQPICAGAMVEACLAAYDATGEGSWRERAQAAFEWFLGRNVVGEPLYDPASGGCRDGLTPAGPSTNQGAEATLAYLGARLALEEQSRRGEAIQVPLAAGWGYGAPP